jgi:hypothetical protein
MSPRDKRYSHPLSTSHGLRMYTIITDYYYYNTITYRLTTTYEGGEGSFRD